MKAATPEQAAAHAFVTGCVARGLTASQASVPPEGRLSTVRGLWADVAQAVVDAATEGSLRACGYTLADIGRFLEAAAAAREPHAPPVSASQVRRHAEQAAPKQAPLQPVESVYLYHWRFPSGEEFGLYRHAADADAAAAARAAEYPGEGLFEVLGMAVLDRPQPQAALAAREPHAADGLLVTAKQERQPSREVNLITDDERDYELDSADIPSGWREDAEPQPAPEMAALRAAEGGQEPPDVPDLDLIADAARRGEAAPDG